jgi:NAD(P)-dependent dehydrogenase (short-subunit alcohol dehydrogenase family)
MTRLADRAILITGATGIAAAAAERLVGEGARVAIVSRTPAHANDLVARLRATGGDAHALTADLSVEAEANDAVEAARVAIGRIDGLFSVAGGSGRRFGDGPIDGMTRQALDATLALNLATQAMTCAAVVRVMLGQPPNDSGTRGSILLMGSVTATNPAPEHFGTHAYAAAKGAVAGLMTAMAATYLRDGIRVNAIAPGLTATPMARRAAEDPAIRAYAARKQPLAGELMDPVEVAHAAVYLLSDESRAVTGQLLKVDGGWSVSNAEPDRP